jgi:DNA-binding LacI/PurR family transcriptional regulator
MSSPAQSGCTLKDLAMESGLSLRVVAGILRGADGRGALRFSEATRERVLALARERSYRPNVTARNFVRGRHGVFALVCHSVYSMSPAFLHGVLKTGLHREMTMILEEVPVGDAGRLRAIKEDFCDGIMLVAGTDKKLDDAVDALGIPVVRINSNRRRGNGCITLDEEGAMRVVVEEMARRGRRCAYALLGVVGHFSDQARKRALVRLSAQYGLAKPSFGVFRGDSCDDPLRLFMKDIRKRPEIDAVVTHEAQFGYLHEACLQMGLVMGRDVSVFCMHPGPLAGFIRPRPDLFRIDQFALGAASVEALVKMIDGRSVSARAFSYEHVPGEHAQDGSCLGLHGGA